MRRPWYGCPYQVATPSSASAAGALAASSDTRSSTAPSAPARDRVKLAHPLWRRPARSPHHGVQHGAPPAGSGPRSPPTAGDAGGVKHATAESVKGGMRLRGYGGRRHARTTVRVVRVRTATA